MSSLNVSLPDQLKNWVMEQVGKGKYSSASDYLRDLIREDIRHQELGKAWLVNHLKPLMETPKEAFVSVTPQAIKKKALTRIKHKK